MPLQRADDAYDSSDRFSGVTAKVRVPLHMMDTVSKVVRTSRQLLNEIGREPTPEEMAEKLGMTLEKMRKVLKIGKEPLSLETSSRDRAVNCIGSTIPRGRLSYRSSFVSFSPFAPPSPTHHDDGFGALDQPTPRDTLVSRKTGIRPIASAVHQSRTQVAVGCRTSRPWMHSRV